MSGPRAPWVRHLVAVWLLFGFFFSVQAWSDIGDQETANPDNVTRLYQIESLAQGQSWFDLTIDRFDFDGIDMHWSRHVDALAMPIYLPVKAIAGAGTARFAIQLVVPLGLLFVALWAVGGMARRLSDLPTAPLFAMALFCGTAGRFHFRPSQLDHHGLNITFVVLILYFLTASDWRWAKAAAGGFVGLSVTSSLETLPILAVIIGAVGLLWLFDHEMTRPGFVQFGTAIVGAGTLSGVLLAPASRLWSTECDVFSLGFVGLLFLPAAGLAAVGGRDWAFNRRLGALAAVGGSGIVWFALVSPECAGGPYVDLPEVIQQEWLQQIQEVNPLLEQLVNDLGATGVAVISILAGLVPLTIRSIRARTVDHVVLLAPLAAATALAFWQIRGIPLAQAVAAPVSGGLVAAVHHRIAEREAARVYRIVSIVAVALFPLVAFVGVTGSEPTSCQDSVDGRLAPGRVAADMTFSTQLLHASDHTMLASAYHRGWPGVLAMYEMFTAEAEAAHDLALAADIDYVVFCTEPSFVDNWGSTRPGSLAFELSEGRTPSWLTQLSDDPARFYAVSG